MAHILMTALSVYPVSHNTGLAQSSNIELWQVINLVGSPILALMLLPAVIEDLQNWLRWRREQSP